MVIYLFTNVEETVTHPESGKSIPFKSDIIASSALRLEANSPSLSAANIIFEGSVLNFHEEFTIKRPRKPQSKY